MKSNPLTGRGFFEKLPKFEMNRYGAVRAIPVKAEQFIRIGSISVCHRSPQDFLSQRIIAAGRRLDNDTRCPRGERDGSEAGGRRG
jgi:hypothetical protein